MISAERDRPPILSPNLALNLNPRKIRGEPIKIRSSRKAMTILEMRPSETS